MNSDEGKAGASRAGAAKRAAIGLGIFVLLTLLLFLAAPDGLYDWIKAGHVIAVISWMAGMLYLPRLLVYHADAPVGSPQSETFKIMERRLLRGIMNPAMAVAWALGLWLAWKGFSFSGGWLHAKLSAVLVMSGLHGYFAGAVRRFAEDRNERPAHHWRIVNEAPTLLLIAIVVLVIVKPF